MRLINLELGGLHDEGRLAIRFEVQRQADPSLAFLVGPNGSGKSRLLEALGRIFAHLSAGVPPGLDFEIEYELGQQRILVTTRAERVESLGSPAPIPEVGGWLLTADLPFTGWTAEHLQEAWPTHLDEVLPLRVVGLSSGPASRLEWAVRDSVASTLSQRLPEGTEALGRDSPGEARAEQRDSEEEMVQSQLRSLAMEPRCLSIFGDELALPLLALLSHRRATEGVDTIRDEVLLKAGLDPRESLRSFSFEIPAEWRNRLPSQQHRLFSQFLDQAVRRVLVIADTTVSQETRPDEQDLRAVFVLNSELRSWISDSADTPFIWFGHLQSWLKAGALRLPQLLLTKADKEGLIRDRDLSDGEFLIVGRYSFLLLLRGHPHCLILFDEPETHFNDRWKIDLVYDLDRILRGNAAQVVIATHSDLTLSDADRSDVFMLDHHAAGDGQQEPHAPPISPFGADRNEISQQVFGASIASGRRAIEIVDEAVRSGSQSKLEDTLERVGPGFQEFRLRYLAEKRAEDAP